MNTIRDVSKNKSEKKCIFPHFQHICQGFLLLFCFCFLFETPYFPHATQTASVTFVAFDICVGLRIQQTKSHLPIIPWKPSRSMLHLLAACQAFCRWWPSVLPLQVTASCCEMGYWAGREAVLFSVSAMTTMLVLKQKKWMWKPVLKGRSKSDRRMCCVLGWNS